MADHVHALGLKFGVHILRGIPRQAVAADAPIKGTDYTAAQIADKDRPCAWNDDNWGIDHSHPGGQEYYDSLVRQFAGWGVDFIKADDMIGPYWEDEIEALRCAIDLLTNSEVLAALRHPVGAREVWREGEHLAWVSEDGTFAGVFNRGEAEAEVRLPWSELGVTRPEQVRDCWNRSDLVPGDDFKIKLPAHGSALLRLA